MFFRLFREQRAPWRNAKLIVRPKKGIGQDAETLSSFSQASLPLAAASPQKGAQLQLSKICKDQSLGARELPFFTCSFPLAK
jgi:hypothetical protein